MIRNQSEDFLKEKYPRQDELKNSVGDQFDYLAYLSDDEIIATVSIEFREQIAFIGVMLVDADFQGQKIGTKLAADALTYCKDQSMQQVITLCTDARMEKIREKQGFVANYAGVHVLDIEEEKSA